LLVALIILFIIHDGCCDGETTHHLRSYEVEPASQDECEENISGNKVLHHDSHYAGQPDKVSGHEIETETLTSARLLRDHHLQQAHKPRNGFVSSGLMRTSRSICHPIPC
jgi:hypothetical protein